MTNRFTSTLSKKGYGNGNTFRAAVREKRGSRRGSKRHSATWAEFYALDGDTEPRPHEAAVSRVLSVYQILCSAKVQLLK